MSWPDEGFTRIELWELARAARPLFDGSAFDGDDDDDDASELRFDPRSAEGARQRARMEEANALWRWVASALAARADVAAIPLLAWMAAVAEERGSDRLPSLERVSDGLQIAAARAHELPRELAASAVDPAREVRRALADGLAVEEAREALVALAGDRDVEVRAAARHRLGAVAPPWWHGLADGDPEPGLGAEARGALERMRALLDARWYDIARLPPGGVLEDAARLPDGLASAFLCVLAQSAGLRPGNAAWLAAAIERGAPMRAVVGVLVAWAASNVFLDDWLAELVALPEPRRVELGAAVAAEILARSAGDRAERRIVGHLTSLFASLWPKSADPSVPLALALGGSIGGAAERAPARSYTSYRLRRVIDPAHPGLEAHREAILDALRRGKPGAWRDLPGPIEERFAPLLLGERRSAARAELASGDRERRAAAIRALAGELRDEREDGPLEPWLEALYAERATRAALLLSHQATAGILERARADLLRGELDLVECACVIDQSGDEWGGIAQPVPVPGSPAHRPRGTAPEPGREIREAEWAVLDALRERADLSALATRELAVVAGALRPGPGLSAGEERCVRAALERWHREGGDALRFVLFALSGKRDAAVDALVAETFERGLREGDPALRRTLVLSTQLYEYGERVRALVLEAE